jgi:hypothetical protein
MFATIFAFVEPGRDAVFRFTIASLIASLFFCQLIFAQSPSPGVAKEQPNAKFAAVFDAVGLNAAIQPPFVVVECGPSGSALKIEGWLIRDEPDRIAVFECSGAIEVLRRPAASETRPKLSKGQALSWAEATSPQSRAAWAITLGDFEAHCKSFLKKGLPKPGKAGPYRPLHIMEMEIEDVLMSGCILGYGANRKGNPKLSRELFSLAAAAHDRLSMHPLGAERNFQQQFVNRIADRMRWSAIADANRGAPREDLLLIWEIIAKLPVESTAREAKVLVEGYQSLIQEDRVWQEPKWYGTLSVEQRTSYWIYRLRDLDDSMYDDSGLVSSTGRVTPLRILQDFFLPQPAPRKVNPAQELKKLGKAALPAIIAHLDDTRPTRTSSLLRYGDCCQQIFEAITNHSIFEKSGDVYPVQAGEEKVCKQRAEKWWAEQQLAK